MPYRIPSKISESGSTINNGVCSLAYTTGFICPEGYDQINNMCYLRSDRSVSQKPREAVGYEFEYYENGGELVGKYSFKGASRDACVVSHYYQGEDKEIGDDINTYYSTEIFAYRIDHLGLTGLQSTFLNNQHDACLYNTYRILYQPGEEDPPEPDIINTFNHGQFFLLPNHPNAIKKLNINYDIVVDTDANFDYSSGPGFSGMNEGPEYNYSAGTIQLSVPKTEAVLEIEPFIKTYIGIAKVSNFDIPSNFESNSLSPSLGNEIKGTDSLKEWEQVVGSCFSWYEIKDKDDLNYIYEGSLGEALNSRDPGQYIVDFKTEVNVTKMKQFIIGNGTPVESIVRMSVLHYPITTYLYPVDMITKLIYPITAYVNNNVDYVEFVAPRNYKTDGNLHFKIEFLERTNSHLDPYDIIWSSSSYDFTTHGENLVFEVNSWFYSETGASWLVIPSDIPDFKNQFRIDAGAESENCIAVRYYLSDALKLILRNKTNVLFRITSLDGTLTEENLN